MRFNIDFNEVRLVCDVKKAIFKRGLQSKGKVQKFIDSEVIRLMEPYTPFDTGFLKNTAPKQRTIIGSGDIIQYAPYARRQYYENRGRGRRGKMWFERMKIDNKNNILKGAIEIANKGK